jgi:MFS family permease
VITRTGRYKIYPVLGAILTGAAMWFLGRITAGTGALALIVPLVVAGVGIGFFVQVALLAGQNAADYADLGVATGALNFFKSIGGALGAALFGAILTAGLAHGNPVHAFQIVFLGAVPCMVLALIAALAMREEPLSEEMLAVVDGTVEAPEY